MSTAWAEHAMSDTVRALWLWLRTSVSASPALTLFSLVLVLAQTGAGPLGTFGVKLIVDGLSGDDMDTFTAGGVLLVSTFGAFFVSISIGNSVSGNLDDRVDGLVHKELLSIGTHIPGVAHHESPSVADRVALIRRSARDMVGGSWTLISTVATIFSTGTVLVLLATVHPLLLVLPVLGIARVWATAYGGRLVRDATEATAAPVRRIERLADLSRDPRHGLELRAFGLRRSMPVWLMALRSDVNRHLTQATRRAAVVDAGVRVCFGAAYVLGVVLAIVLASRQQATVGDVALVVLLAPQVDQAAGAVAGSVRELANVVRLFGHYVWLRDYAKANAWDDAVRPAPNRLEEGITLRNVEFAYPETERPVLRDIDLHIAPGTTVALVGPNGAGKTSLVKLLARLYDPTAGAVLVDGGNLRAVCPQDWRKRLSATFQDYVRFELTAREAIGVGDVERIGDTPALRRALASSDATAFVDGLAHGLETQLGTRFEGGTELSGGQWQRLALARGFMRERPLLLLLDEPVSALDPETEAALFDRLADKTGEASASTGDTGGITVIVSHRLATVRDADLIVVLEDGCVIECGDHESLLASDGTYARMVRLQAHNYR